MPVFNPRTRLVNFRVSEEEFQRLKESCARSGARSVSDFARAAVLTEAAAGPSLPILELSHRWNRLEERLDAFFTLQPASTGMSIEASFAQPLRSSAPTSSFEPASSYEQEKETSNSNG